MRRFAVSLTLLVALAVLPAPASAASGRCSIEVTPSSGGPTDIYRISGSNFPVDPSGPLEVRIDIKRTGSRGGAILFLFLVPGVTEFYVDYNESSPEPTSGLTAGRYLVLAEASHIAGCHATDQFVVE